uniref:Uncharacterized protein n=1 Tax=Aegilops tauschii subsp. strangulata TaxID=200361 RepID=A0A452XFW5_AEGTS
MQVLNSLHIHARSWTPKLVSSPQTCTQHLHKEQLETEVARQEPWPWDRWRGPAARAEAREDRGESIRMERNRVGSYPESAAGMPPWTMGRPPPCIRLGGQGRSRSRGRSMRRGWHAALPIHGVACTHLPAGEPERRASAPWDLGWRLQCMDGHGQWMATVVLAQHRRGTGGERERDACWGWPSRPPVLSNAAAWKSPSALGLLPVAGGCGGGPAVEATARGP